MSFKSIEMQLALPRTQDIGKLQEQLNQKSVILQHHTSEEEKIKADRNRKKSIKTNGSEMQGFTSEEHHSASSSYYYSRKNISEEENHAPSPHPYKGKHIDISL
jgi:hypothetical protein